MIKMDVVGRLTRDPEWKDNDKTSFVVFSVASNSAKGEATYVNVFLYDERMMNFACDYMKKGSAVYVSGYASFDVYKDKPQINLTAKMLDFALTSRKDDSGGEGTSESKSDESGKNNKRPVRRAAK